MVTTWRHINSHLLQVPSTSVLLTVMANTHFFNLYTTRNASQRGKQSKNYFMLSCVRPCTTEETYQNSCSPCHAFQIYWSIWETLRIHGGSSEDKAYKKMCLYFTSTFHSCLVLFSGPTWWRCSCRCRRCLRNVSTSASKPDFPSKESLAKTHLSQVI